MNVLISSYIFPPNTTIVSGLRPYSWHVSFNKFGLRSTVVTRHWTNNPILTSEALQYEDESPLKVTEDQYGAVFYLPYRNGILFKIISYCRGFALGKFIARICELLGLMIGRFTNEPDMDKNFFKECDRIVRDTSSEAIIVTALPLSAIKLGRKLSQRHNIPLIVDFRDHWNNNLLNSSFKFSRRAKFYFFIQEIYIKKWLRSASLISSVSQPILDEVGRLSSAPQTLIHNGFEPGIFDNITAQPSKSIFTISMIGMMYPVQDIEFIIAGFNHFLELCGNPADCIIKFIGQDYAPEVSKKLKEGLPSQNIETTPRVPRNQALQLMKESHVLYYAGWRGWKGIFSGKIFEYIAAERNILVAPGDGDVIDNLLAETKAGVSAHTVEKFGRILADWYFAWKAEGCLSYHGDENVISKYNRKTIAEKFAMNIRSVISAHKAAK